MLQKAGLAPLWQGVREARDVQCSATASAEQCLQLNVHVPAGAGPWPVLAWVATGGLYNPEALVREGIILVVMYYRYIRLRYSPQPHSLHDQHTILEVAEYV